MIKSLIFNDEDIVENSSYKDAVDADVFLQKVRDLCVYEQDYTYHKVVNLKKAEEILLFIKKLMD